MGNQTKVSSIDFNSLEHLERFRRINFSISDALATILLLWGENDIGDINNTVYVYKANIY